MRIGIDIDDTITDTYLIVLKHIAEYFKRDYEELKSIGYTYDEFFTDSEFIGFEKFVDDNFHKLIPTLKPKEGAVEVINKLKQDGHEIIIVTARSSAKPNQNIDFLNSYNIPFDKFYEGIKDKGELSKKENIDVLIDDSYKHYQQCQRENIRAILFDAPYNRKYEECERVTNWNEVYDIVSKK